MSRETENVGTTASRRSGYTSLAGRLLSTLVLTLAMGGFAALWAMAIHFGFAWLAEQSQTQVEWLPAMALGSVAVFVGLSTLLVFAIARGAGQREAQWAEARRRSIDSRVDEVLSDLDFDTL